MQEETKIPFSSTLLSGREWGMSAEFPTLASGPTASQKQLLLHPLPFTDQKGQEKWIWADDPSDPQVKHSLGRGGLQRGAAAVCWANSPGDYLFKFQWNDFNLADLGYMFSFFQEKIFNLTPDLPRGCYSNLSTQLFGLIWEQLLEVTGLTRISYVNHQNTSFCFCYYFMVLF